MSKRNRLEIIYTILTLIQENDNSIKPTPLLRYTNISSQSFNEYYAELLDKELIREDLDSKKRKYITLTDKGFKYIQKYKIILGFMDEFDL